MDPQKKISIYYDGTCRLCSGIIEKLEHSTQRERIESIPFQKHLPQHVTPEEADKDVHAVDENGTVYKGADAVLFITSQYPRWRWLAAIGRLPLIRHVFGLTYRLVADNRRWLRKRDIPN